MKHEAHPTLPTPSEGHFALSETGEIVEDFARDSRIAERTTMQAHGVAELPTGEPISRYVSDWRMGITQSLVGVINAAPGENYGIVRIEHSDSEPVHMVTRIGNTRESGRVVGFFDQQTQATVHRDTPRRDRPGDAVFTIRQAGYGDKMVIQNETYKLLQAGAAEQVDRRRFSRKSIMRGLKRALFGEEPQTRTELIDDLGWVADLQTAERAYREHQAEVAARQQRDKEHRELGLVIGRRDR